jgi:hypothetical protein
MRDTVSPQWKLQMAVINYGKRKEVAENERICMPTKNRSR